MSDKNIIKIPATLSKYEGMSHNSMKVQFHTQENLSDDMKNVITSRHEKYGHLLFLHEEAEDDIILETIKSLPKLVVDKEEKTPSQRLRGVLFILYEQNKKEGQTFDEFYRQYMERLIDNIKSKLT